MKITIENLLRESFLSVLIVSVLLLTAFTYLPHYVWAQTSAEDSVLITLTVDAGISITSPSDTSMSRSIGVAADTAVASTTWTVRTNNITGYNLTLKATSSPAMKNNASSTVYVSDFSTTTPTTWSVPSASSSFGFSAYGTDVNTTTWGTGGDCQASAHTPSATLKYSAFTTSTSSVVATRAYTTPYAGIATVVCYAVGQNTYYIPSGTYTATIVATAVTI